MDTKRDTFFLNKKQKPEKEANKHNEKDRKVQDDKQKRQDNFDNNRDITEKKPFDKKTYRLKKYSKKYKLEQWEEQRKKRLLREFHKETKSDPMSGSYKPKSFDEDAVDNPNIGRYVRHPDLIEKENKKKKDPFQKAKEQFNKLKEDREAKQQVIAKAKDEKRQKLEEYKKKKQDRFKKLSKKNKKGQPDMTGRLEMLLEKIQKG